MQPISNPTLIDSGAMTGEAIKNLLRRVAIRVFFTRLHVSTATNNISSRDRQLRRGGIAKWIQMRLLLRWPKKT